MRAWLRLPQEVLLGKRYGSQADMFSLGVVLYMLLCGYPPFYSAELDELIAQVIDGKTEFASPYWDDISSEAKDLVSQLLAVNPSDRPNAVQVLKHPWISGIELVRQDYDDDGQAMSSVRAKLQRAFLKVRALNRMRQSAGTRPINPSPPPSSAK